MHLKLLLTVKVTPEEVAIVVVFSNVVDLVFVVIIAILVVIDSLVGATRVVLATLRVVQTTTTTLIHIKMLHSIVIVHIEGLRPWYLVWLNVVVAIIVTQHVVDLLVTAIIVVNMVTRPLNVLKGSVKPQK